MEPLNVAYPLASSSWDDKEILSMERVIRSGKFSMGTHVSNFEQGFAEHFGSKFAIMSNSGSSANLLAMSAVRFRSFEKNPIRRDVIVPTVSWSTTYFPVTQAGYRLKFVDVSRSTLNATSTSIENSIDEQTAGILAVNLLGNPSELPALRKLADKHSIFLIEDNCESMGAEIEGGAAGTFGDIGTFSTFFSHHMSTMEGGMCLTDDEELAQIMVSLRAHGWTRDLPAQNFLESKTGNGFYDSYRFILPGYNLRPLELSGAIGSQQLIKLDRMISVRRENAAYFKESVGELKGYLTQQELGKSSWFGFSIILDGPNAGRRKALLETLTARGIEYRPIVAGNFTRNPVIKYLDCTDIGVYPAADEVGDEGFFVGNHHYDIRKEIDLLASTLGKFAKGG